MKTKEELNALKEEVEILNAKLAELSEEELTQVTGGIAPGRRYWYKNTGAGGDGIGVEPDAAHDETDMHNHIFS